MARIGTNFQLETKPNGLGLSCTAEGLTLAGVPLLHKTISGLAPRPRSELAILMKGAYGDGIDPTRSYPGLDVIAQALNQGDIGRAMIAAIQLRLPNLNVEGAAQIPYFDQALKKYNPNEPRDEHGRWTTGDGSSSATPESPDLGHGGMKPILVSDFEDLHDPRIPPSLLVNMTLSRECVGNAKQPRYY